MVVLLFEDCGQIYVTVVEFVADCCRYFGACLIVVALQTDNLPFISFGNVLDQIGDGINRSFQQNFFGEFGKKSPNFVVLEIIINLLVGLEKFVFVHQLYL